MKSKKTGRGKWTAAHKKAFKKTIRQRKLNKLISEGQKKYDERHRKALGIEQNLMSPVSNVEYEENKPIPTHDEFDVLRKIDGILTTEVNYSACKRIAQYLAKKYPID